MIYDRVRELFKNAGGDLPLVKTINRAINQVLSRTIITSLSTLLTVCAIAVFTKGEIQSFAIAICVGVVVGTYSTMYIASPMTVYTQKYLDNKNARPTRPAPKKKKK